MKCRLLSKQRVIAPPLSFCLSACINLSLTHIMVPQSAAFTGQPESLHASASWNKQKLRMHNHFYCYLFLAF